MSFCWLTPTKALFVAISILLLTLSRLRLETTSISRSTWNDVTNMENRNGIVRQMENNRHHQRRKILDHVVHLQSDSNPIPNSNTSMGYVMNIKYPGQQGAGIRALASFQCFLGSLTRQLSSQLSIAEPFFEGSKLRGISTERDRLKLSSLFDFNHFNAASRQAGNPELISVDEFVQKRPSPVILVNIENALSNMVSWASPSSNTRDSNTRDTAGDRFKCLESGDLARLPQLTQLMIRNMMKKMSELESRECCVVRAVQLKVSNKTLPRIHDLIFGGWSPQEVTLVFDFWSGPYYIPIPVPANRINCKHNFNKNGIKFQFKPSQKLMRDTENYRNAYLGENKSTVAVMMRVEKVLEVKTKTTQDQTKGRLTYNIDALKNCFKEVQQIKNQLDQGSKMTPLVTLDIGDYGSDSFRKRTFMKAWHLASEILVTLYQNKWSMREWEESFVQAAGGESNKAYIAALQRTLASSAECLILVGGGNFQTIALQDYMRMHEEREREGNGKICVHLACMAGQNDVQIRRILGYHYHRQTETYTEIEN